MKIKKRRLWIFILPVMIAVMGLAALGGALWYRQALTPIDSNNHSVTRISIKQGDTSASIADELVQKKLIRNALAFSFYFQKFVSLLSETTCRQPYPCGLWL